MSKSTNKVYRIESWSSWVLQLRFPSKFRYISL